MPIAKINGIEVETECPDIGQFYRTGVIRDDGFAVCDTVDRNKQLKFDLGSIDSGATVTLQPQSGSSGTFQIPAVAGGLLALVGGAAALQYAAPANGGSVTVNPGISNLVLEPAGTIAGATVIFPAAPTDGFMLNLSSTAIITTLTLTAGGADSIVNAIATLAAAAFATYVYRASSAKWYRIG